MSVSKKPEDIEDSFFKKLRRKRRLVVMNDETFEEQRQFLVSRLDLITYGLFFLIVVGLSTYFLVAYTPIRESIPGYPNVAEQQAMVERDLKNLEYLQQLEHFAEIEALYHQNVAAVLKDQLPVDPTNSDSVVLDSVDFSNLNLEGSEEDSLLRIKIDEREKYSLMAKDDVKDRDRMRGVYFFSPINGSVSQKFDSKSKHFGVDIVAPKDEAIKATLDGTIMFTEWTYESGYVLHIQHSHNLVSVYKHNSFLLKKTGEVVKAGDPIAIIGNTGKHTSGPHLHFELWHEGVPIDPQEYIGFQEDVSISME